MQLGRLLTSRAAGAVGSSLYRGARDLPRHARRPAYRGATFKRHDSDMATLRGDINRLPDGMRERLLPYHLQLGRLSAAAAGDHNGSLGSRVPLSVAGDDGAARPQGAATTTAAGDDWQRAGRIAERPARPDGERRPRRPDRIAAESAGCAGARDPTAGRNDPRAAETPRSG